MRTLIITDGRIWRPLVGLALVWLVLLAGDSAPLASSPAGQAPAVDGVSTTGAVPATGLAPLTAEGLPATGEETIGPEPLPPVIPWLEGDGQLSDAPKGLRMKWKTKIHRVPDIRQRRAIIAAMDPIIETIQAPVPSLVRIAAEKLAETGYELKEYYGPEGRWLILRASGNHAGAGYYLFRTGPLDQELMIQAPHAIHDLFTDMLTKEVFRSLPVRTAFFSDYQRYGGLGREPTPNSPYDLAQNPDTLFQDLTIQWMLKRPKTVVVQPHGFASSSVEEGVDLIISPGTRNTPSPLFESLVRSLTAAYPDHGLRVYPKDVRVLGGTLNQQGRAVRAARGEFVHIEMSMKLRRAFRNSSEERIRFGRALLDGLDKP
jgi:hypothetical protein